MADTSEPSAKVTPATKTAVAKIPPTKPAPKATFVQNTWYTKSRRGVKLDAILGSALEALRANRMRSFLTMLGEIIGVSAVIAVVSLTEGVNQSVSARFASLGTNVITISPGAASTNGARSAAGTEQTLTMADAQAVGQLDHVVLWTPLLSTSGQVVYGSQNWNTSVRGVDPSYQTIQSWQIDGRTLPPSSGRVITSRDQLPPLQARNLAPATLSEVWVVAVVVAAEPALVAVAMALAVVTRMADNKPVTRLQAWERQHEGHRRPVIFRCSVEISLSRQLNRILLNWQSYSSVLQPFRSLSVALAS